MVDASNLTVDVFGYKVDRVFCVGVLNVVITAAVSRVSKILAGIYVFFSMVGLLGAVLCHAGSKNKPKVGDIENQQGIEGVKRR